MDTWENVGGGVYFVQIPYQGAADIVSGNGFRAKVQLGWEEE